MTGVQTCALPIYPEKAVQKIAADKTFGDQLPAQVVEIKLPLGELCSFNGSFESYMNLEIPKLKQSISLFEFSGSL